MHNYQLVLYKVLNTSIFRDRENTSYAKRAGYESRIYKTSFKPKGKRNQTNAQKTAKTEHTAVTMETYQRVV